MSEDRSDAIKKCSVLGIDGGTFRILKPLMEKGYMSNLKNIRDNGVYGGLDSTIPSHTAAAWSSFATGCNPGKHGVFEWSNRKQDEADDIVDSRSIQSTTFYEILERKGKTCCLINLPLSFPPRIKGPAIGSFITRGDFVHPSSLRKELDFTDYKIVPSLWELLAKPLESLEYTLDCRMKVAKKLFERNPDLFFLLFSELDTIQHFYFDEILSAIKEDKESRFFKIYEKIDECIGWFMEKSSDRLTFIVSDHGFKSFNGTFYINQWLYENNFLKIDKDSSMNVVYGRDNPVINFIRKNPVLREIALKIYSVLTPLNPFPKNVWSRLSGHLSGGIDYDESLAYCPSSELGCLYLNDQVLDDRDKSTIRSDIISRLRENGFVGSVFPREEYYCGGCLEQAPDILIEEDDLYISRNLIGKKTDDILVNNHEKKGVFFAFGKGVKGNQEIQKPVIYDIAPTILSFFGLKPPKEMDGRVLDEIFVEDLTPSSEKDGVLFEEDSVINNITWKDVL